MRVVAVAGGTGSAKLLRGLRTLPVDLTVVANVGDNVWMYGAYVCPDVDISLYTLSGMADETRGWGIRGDTFSALDRLAELGMETWFRMGDQDFAVCLARTEMIRRGMTLTEATRKIGARLGAKGRVLPASDQPVETRVLTAKGDLHLQEFWVRDGGKGRVERVRYRGASRAVPTKEVARAFGGADRVLVCPANPVTSIGPMLAMPGFASLLKSASRVVGLSPMDGSKPFSGPAGKLMESAGMRPDSVGVAKAYSPFLDSLVISEGDRGMRDEIEDLGVTCIASNTLMKGPKEERDVARVLLEA